MTGERGWFGRRKHQHEWGPWRVTLIRLTDCPRVEPAQEARHCRTCHEVEFRLRPQITEEPS